MGQLSYFLGIEVHQRSDGISLSQLKYASDIVNLPHFTDSKVKYSPLESNCKLYASDGEPLTNPTLYR